MNYCIAKKHSASKPHVTIDCKLCYRQFPGFYSLRQHKDTQNGFPIKTAIVDPDDIFNEVYDTNLKEESRSSQHFLVDSELERARHNVFNHTIENLNAADVKILSS